MELACGVAFEEVMPLKSHTEDKYQEIPQITRRSLFPAQTDACSLRKSVDVDKNDPIALEVSPCKVNCFCHSCVSEVC